MAITGALCVKAESIQLSYDTADIRIKLSYFRLFYTRAEPKAFTMSTSFIINNLQPLLFKYHFTKQYQSSIIDGMVHTSSIQTFDKKLNICFRFSATIKDISFHFIQ